jgi:cobalt-zinc-cadmium efflux system outer membrane protein
VDRRRLAAGVHLDDAIPGLRSGPRRAAALSIAPPSLAAAQAPLDEIAGARRVCAEGPAAAVARAERMRGDAAVTEAGVLPNPSISVEHQRTLSGPSEDETVVGLSVPLGLGGRRFVLQDAAQARREQAFADAQASRFEAALAFREAYVTAALDEARLAVLTAQQTTLDALTATIERLDRGGESAGYDLLRQRTQARLHARLAASMRARATASRALLEAAVGRDLKRPPGYRVERGHVEASLTRARCGAAVHRSPV